MNDTPIDTSPAHPARRPSRWTAGTLSLATVGAIVLSACGGGSSDTATDAAPTGSPATSAPDASSAPETTEPTETTVVGTTPPETTEPDTAGAASVVPCDAEPEVLTTADGVDFVRTPDSCFEQLPDWPNEPQYVEIDGLRQAYADEGPADGEVVLLLHGQPSWSQLYRDMIPVLTWYDTVADAGDAATEAGE